MKLSMKSLAALLMMLNGAVMASENVNTPENRQFLKQQENLSRQLREKPDHQLKAWAEKQVLENPLQRSDNHFLDELVRKQQASQDGKPRQGALYFVSFSIPEEGLKRMLGETRHYGIPATLRGMVAGLVMTVLTVGLVSCAGKSLPRFWPGDFFPVFYACHLAVLGVLAL
ncbi:TraX family protein [Escherichia coli]